MGKSIFQSLNPPPGPQMPGVGQYLNPIQQMQQVMTAMQNPAMYLKQRFPDIPDEIMYDPNKVWQYLQQTRGITNQDLQQIQAQVPGMQNGGNPWQR